MMVVCDGYVAAGVTPFIESTNNPPALICFRFSDAMVGLVIISPRIPSMVMRITCAGFACCAIARPGSASTSWTQRGLIEERCHIF